MARGDIVVRVLGDTADIERKFGSLSKKVSGLERLSSIGKSLTAGVTLPIVGIGVAAVRAFSDSAKVASQTDAVLRSTGHAAHVTAGDVNELAQTLKRKSAFDDEAIQSGENLLLTFTNIRNEAGAGNDIFNQSTKVMLDMSQALGQDTKTSALQLGKALNDPIKGVTALQRVGVSFTSEQKNQIKTLVESGRSMDAQKVILRELTKEFGGSAEAYAKTAGGKMQQATNALGDAMESLGAIIAPVAQRIASFATTVAERFQSLSPHAQKLIVTFLAVAAGVGPVLIAGVKIISAFKKVGQAFGILSHVLKANPYLLLIAATIAIVVLVVKNWNTIKGFLSSTWNVIKAAAVGVFNFLKSLFLNFTPVGQIIQHWRDILGFFGGVWERIKNGFSGAWSFIVSAFKGALNALIGAWNALDFGIHVHLPDWSFLGPLAGRGFDVDDIFPDIPYLAKGGVVKRPTLAMIGERGPEAVIPLRRGAGSVSNHYTITVHVPVGAHPADVGKALVESIRAYERRNGTRWRAA